MFSDLFRLVQISYFFLGGGVYLYIFGFVRIEFKIVLVFPESY